MLIHYIIDHSQINYVFIFSFYDSHLASYRLLNVNQLSDDDRIKVASLTGLSVFLGVFYMHKRYVLCKKLVLQKMLDQVIIICFFSFTPSIQG